MIKRGGQRRGVGTVKILYNTRRPVIICPHLCDESMLCMFTSVSSLTPALSSQWFLYVIQEVGNMGFIFGDFIFLNMQMYISVIILSFFSIAASAPLLPP